MSVNSKFSLRVSKRKRVMSFVALFLIVVLFFSCFTGLFSSVSFFVTGEPDKVVNNEKDLKSAINYAQNRRSVFIALDKDITLTDTLVIPANKHITLTSNKLFGVFKLVGVADKSTLLVEEDGVLNIDGIIVTHKDDAGIKGGGVYVSAGGLLNLYSGEISGNTVVGRGMPILVGGYTSYGGGVCNYGNFTMYGGKIYGNAAQVGHGGGVFNMGIFDLVSGEISGNNATSGFHTDDDYEGSGGGVDNRCIFIMSGGKISRNTAKLGGGVYNRDAFFMSGGEISGNTANAGGGILIQWGSFDRSGGVISGNTANNGADVYPEGSGEISDGNNGSSNGGNWTTGGNNGGGMTNGNNSSSIVSEFSLHDFVFVVVGIAVALVVIIVAVLLFSSKKELDFLKETTI